MVIRNVDKNGPDAYWTSQNFLDTQESVHVSGMTACSNSRGISAADVQRQLTEVRH